MVLAVARFPHHNIDRYPSRKATMPPKRRKRVRFRERFTEKTWRPYVLVIGQLALAWNAFHESLAGIFYLLLSRQSELHEDEDEDRDQRPIALWASANFGRAKRQMLKAVVETERDEITKAFPGLKDDLLWILAQADKLEDSRNNSVHYPLIDAGFSLIPGWVIPNLLYGNERAKRLVPKEGQPIPKDILAEFRWCRDAALVLRDFTEAIILP
jgi:hypothetical protein